MFIRFLAIWICWGCFLAPPAEGQIFRRFSRAARQRAAQPAYNNGGRLSAVPRYGQTASRPATYYRYNGQTYIRTANGYQLITAANTSQKPATPTNPNDARVAGNSGKRSQVDIARQAPTSEQRAIAKTATADRPRQQQQSGVITASAESKVDSIASGQPVYRAEYIPFNPKPTNPAPRGLNLSGGDKTSSADPIATPAKDRRVSKPDPTSGKPKTDTTFPSNTFSVLERIIEQ